MTESLHLPSELSIYSVGELHEAWMARWGAGSALPPDEEFVIHADQVEQIDAAGVQLLMSLRRFVVDRGARPRFKDPSAMLMASCASLGVFALLGRTQAAEDAS